MTSSTVAGSGETMRAAYITAVGRPESIRIGRLPIPVPAPNEVLVKVFAVAVNPVDGLIRSGAYRTPMPFPFVLGRDLVGTVVTGASEAEGVPFAAGEWVWCNSLGHAGRQGACAEYAVVPNDRLYRLPPGVDPLNAVAVLHPAATAYLGLFVHGGVGSGDAIYIGGAGGNVGGAAVRLARARGACVIAGARAGDFGRCREAGATVTLDYRDANLCSEIRSAAPDGLALYWDTSGHHDDFAGAVELLRIGGRILITAGRTERPQLPVGALYTQDRSIVGFVISNARVDELADAARCINDRLAAGALPARIAAVLPLERTDEAHRLIDRGGLSGRRVLITLQPPAAHPGGGHPNR